MPYTSLEIRAKLETTRDQLIDLRITVLSKPRPTYNIDGQEVKWAEYLKQLDASISRINEEIAIDDEPVEGITVGYSGP